MRIGRADFEVGNLGRVHQAVLDAVPEDEAVEEAELRAIYYDQTTESPKPTFEQVIENLSGQVVRRQIGDHNFYIRRKAWLSSAEVARRLNVSKRTVQAWGQQGLLLGRRVGGRLRFAAEAVEDWARGTKQGAESSKGPDPVLTQVWDNDKDREYERL